MFPTLYGALTAGGFVGAYDDIPNLVHVYEIARRTLTSYTGNLVRLRRASDSAELDFGPVDNGDLDVASIATWAGGDSFIVTIYDQIGGNNVTQATTSAQPTFVASGQGGRAVGRYNGTSTFLQVAYASALSQPFSFYAAAQLDASVVGNNTNIYIFDSNSSVRGFFGQTAVQFPDTWSSFFGARLDGNASDASWHLHSLLVNGASSNIWRDGTLAATGNTGASNPTGITIGRHATVADNYWLGDIAPVIVADPSHDTTARQAVEAAINSYYAIF